MDKAVSGLKCSLKSTDKLRLKSEFDYVRNYGKKSVCSLFVLSAASSPDGNLRGGVICGKKYSLKAVERNRARRLCWESFRMLKSQISPAHFVLIPRIKMKDGCKQPEVQLQMERMFKKAGLLSNGENFSLRLDSQL